MEQILIALSNGIIEILTALSKFDVTQLDNTKVLLISQLLVDNIRLIKIIFNF